VGKAAKKSPPKDPGGHKWEGPLPKGWTDASRKKFWNTLTSAAPKHKVTECIKRMEGKLIVRSLAGVKKLPRNVARRRPQVRFGFSKV
jgi:hypothetical protein